MQDNFKTDVIIDHYKHPRNTTIPSDYNYSGKYANTYCGDEVSVFFTIKNDKITQVGFEGSGCSICIASASVFLENVIGKTLSEIQNIPESNVLELTGTEKESNRTTCALIVKNAVVAVKENK